MFKVVIVSVIFAVIVAMGFSFGKGEPISLQHVVLVWLKEPGNVEHRNKVIEASQSFRDIPGVIRVQVGKAIPSERDIVDDSFDVGILVAVPDERRLQEYLDHPIHQKAKNDVLLPLVEKILVYDFKL